jgi:DNA-binding MarR family transcriptional regulator
LEKAGYVTRQPNPKDRRGVLIAVTPKWQKVARPLVSDVVKAHAELIASYSEEELKVIADFLTRFTKNVSDQTKAIENTEKR